MQVTVMLVKRVETAKGFKAELELLRIDALAVKGKAELEGDKDFIGGIKVGQPYVFEVKLKETSLA